MANSVYFRNCLKAIRHTVYGRDNRKPIADAIQGARAYHSKRITDIAAEAIKKLNDISEEAVENVGKMNPTLTRLEQKLPRAIGSFITDPQETWYTYDYRDVELQYLIPNEDRIAEIVTDRMLVSSLDESEWNSFDISFDAADFTFDDAPKISNEGNYELVDTVDGDSAQKISENEDAYVWVIPNPIKETHVHHGEDYTLIITRINGT